MTRWGTRFSCAVLLSLPITVFAGTYTFTIVPAEPIGGEPFRIRVTKPAEMCGTPLPAALAVQDLGGGVMRYAIPGSDGCQQNVPAQNVAYDVPALAAGTYTFRFAICGLYPVDCLTLEDRPVTINGVAAAAAPARIPMWSWPAMLALIGCVGLVASRRR